MASCTRKKKKFFGPPARPRRKGRLAGKSFLLRTRCAVRRCDVLDVHRSHRAAARETLTCTCRTCPRAHGSGTALGAAEARGFPHRISRGPCAQRAHESRPAFQKNHDQKNHKKNRPKNHEKTTKYETSKVVVIATLAHHLFSWIVLALAVGLAARLISELAVFTLLAAHLAAHRAAELAV